MQGFDRGDRLFANQFLFSFFSHALGVLRHDKERERCRDEFRAFLLFFLPPHPHPLVVRDSMEGIRTRFSLFLTASSPFTGISGISTVQAGRCGVDERS